ncbi:MAG: hypothetical protein ACFB8W_06020 [Elainellaceae cyanobacterium]
MVSSDNGILGDRVAIAQSFYFRPHGLRFERRTPAKQEFHTSSVS